MPTRVRVERAVLPEVMPLRQARGFVVCDYEWLCRAGAWIRLAHGPDCPWIA